MRLLEQLREDMMTARKEKNADRLSILQVVLAAIKNEQISKQSELADTEIEQTIASLVKRLKDSISDFEKAGRTDLLQKTQQEIDILESYLPKQLSDEELNAIVQSTMDEVGPDARDVGKIMGAVMPKVRGYADGTRVRTAVQRLLS